MGDDSRRYDSTAASHRALRGIREELHRHPLVREARGHPADLHTHLVATLAPRRAGRNVDDATLTVRWFAGAEPDARPEFSFHYTDDTGVDFGWHHEPNPHVDGWGHFQCREDPDAAYHYEPYTFSSLVPTRVVWEVVTELSSRLQARDH